MNSINKESIKLLREKFKKDIDAIQLIQDCLQSFMDYANQIYQLEIYRILFDYDNTNKEDFKEQVISLDQNRTKDHKVAIVSLVTLNRLCKQNNVPLVYAGALSYDSAYRDIIADTILKYVAEVIGIPQK